MLIHPDQLGIVGPDNRCKHNNHRKADEQCNNATDEENVRLEGKYQDHIKRKQISRDLKRADVEMALKNKKIRVCDFNLHSSASYNMLRKEPTFPIVGLSTFMAIDVWRRSAGAVRRHVTHTHTYSAILVGDHHLGRYRPSTILDAGKDSDGPVGYVGTGAKESDNFGSGVLGTAAEKFDGSFEDFVGVTTEEVDGTVPSVDDRTALVAVDDDSDTKLDAASDVYITAEEVDGTGKTGKISLEEEIDDEKQFAVAGANEVGNDSNDLLGTSPEELDGPLVATISSGVPEGAQMQVDHAQYMTRQNDHCIPAQVSRLSAVQAAGQNMRHKATQVQNKSYFSTSCNAQYFHNNNIDTMVLAATLQKSLLSLMVSVLQIVSIQPLMQSSEEYTVIVDDSTRDDPFRHERLEIFAMVVWIHSQVFILSKCDLIGRRGTDVLLSTRTSTSGNVGTSLVLPYSSPSYPMQTSSMPHVHRACLPVTKCGRHGAAVARKTWIAFPSLVRNLDHVTPASQSRSTKEPFRDFRTSMKFGETVQDIRIGRNCYKIGGSQLFSNSNTNIKEALIQIPRPGCVGKHRNIQDRENCPTLLPQCREVKRETKIRDFVMLRNRTNSLEFVPVVVRRLSKDALQKGLTDTGASFKPDDNTETLRQQMEDLNAAIVNQSHTMLSTQERQSKRLMCQSIMCMTSKSVENGINRVCRKKEEMPLKGSSWTLATAENERIRYMRILWIDDGYVSKGSTAMRSLYVSCGNFHHRPENLNRLVYHLKNCHWLIGVAFAAKTLPSSLLHDDTKLLIGKAGQQRDGLLKFARICLRNIYTRHLPPRSACLHHCTQKSQLAHLSGGPIDVCVCACLADKFRNLQLLDGGKTPRLRRMHGDKTPGLRRLDGDKTPALRRLDGDKTPGLRWLDGGKMPGLRWLDVVAMLVLQRHEVQK
ncbi:hypothetical protein PR048_012280 [Dryococelus australis]|uniref:Uncharacterized protein n=1 Tax=Dryococelus australis TaxID=614101 RepID=A0ABQ9HPJ8_9NEOP|nr:hypothetical protein PR048_012280 [Dryococelus australis]